MPLQHVTLPPPNSWLCRVHVGGLEAWPRLPSWAALLETPPVLSGDLPAWRFLSRPASPWTWSISLCSSEIWRGTGRRGCLAKVWRHLARCCPCCGPRVRVGVHPAGEGLSGSYPFAVVPCSRSCRGQTVLGGGSRPTRSSGPPSEVPTRAHGNSGCQPRAARAS